MVSRWSRLVFLLTVILGFPALSIAQPVNTTCHLPDYLFLNESAQYHRSSRGRHRSPFRGAEERSWPTSRRSMW